MTFWPRPTVETDSEWVAAPALPFGKDRAPTMSAPPLIVDCRRSLLDAGLDAAHRGGDDARLQRRRIRLGAWRNSGPPPQSRAARTGVAASACAGPERERLSACPRRPF